MSADRRDGDGAEAPALNTVERDSLRRAPTDPRSLVGESGSDELRRLATAETDEQLDDVRPQGGLLRARMRASLSEKMFGVAAEPVRMGRFVLLDRLGQGGMGDVYSAYDPKLDRRVALKLLRVDSAQTGDGARERLEREAMALAQLSHPNVVPVHDVGSIQSKSGDIGPVDEQMFIVMELVEGQTLRTWVAAQPRSWRAIVHAYRQAGEGLAAAHAVELIHRDFKPDNVQVGEDGRIRVLDFGLARSIAADGPERGEERGEASDASAQDRATGGEWRLDAPFDLSAMAVTAGVASDVARNAETAPVRARTHRPSPGLSPGLSHSSSQSGALYTPLTRTGALLGTPAYMSPEQFAGRHTGPASDQFSFCASLYEALYGERPFPGESLAELAENTIAGRLAPQPRASGVPGWLYPILTRGLAARPDERHSSMTALLAELGRDPARTRRRRLRAGLMAALIAAVAALSVYALTRENRVSDPCQGARERLAGVFDDSERDRLRAVFHGIDHPYARRVWPRVVDELDRYAERWVTMHERACRAHRRGEQSGELLDRRMACLERRRRALGSAAAVLAETDAEALEGAAEVVHNLPSIDYCADEAALLAQVPPPESAEVARQVSEIRTRASRAQALGDAGRYDDALAVVTPLIDAAEPVGYRPLSAELRLLQGRMLWKSRDNLGAIGALRKAAEFGLSAGMYDLGVEAVARLIYAEGVTNDGKGALARLSLFEALAEHIPDTSFARALLYNNVGVVYRARQQPERARQYYERALAARAPRDGRVELAGIGYNLMLITDDYARRDELLRATLAEFERALGATHPRVLKQRVLSAPHLLSPGEAHAILEPACEHYQSVHPELRRQRGKCLRILADLEVELGRPERAAQRYAQAADLLAGRKDPFEAISRGLGALYADEAQRAVAILAPLLERIDGPRPADARPRQWWEQQPIAIAALGLGFAHLALADPAAAVAPLERAHDILRRLAKQTRSVARQQRLARTEIALARALCPEVVVKGTPPGALREPCARAKALREKARAWYAQAGPGYAHQVREP